jgi:hypothetical protein
MSAANGVLRAKIEAAALASGHNLGDLTVQSPGTDPYRLDTKTGRRLAHWFAEQIERLVPRGDIHLRGLHYRLLGTKKPDGSPYLNNDDNWIWVQQASACARWLHAVPFSRIADGRNDDPEILTVEETTSPGFGHLHIFGHAEVPDEVMPSVFASRPSTRQPYRIILIGEKSSLRDELYPVAASVAGELLLPTGEASDTMIERMAMRAAADDRPAVVLYFHDFDPAGWAMPIHVSRKLQALVDGCFVSALGLDIQVFPVALTLRQCIDYDLPSTPLKESERRADTWRTDTGREQTELDAMIALHPGAIRQIARDAIRPFFDPTLAERAQILANAWGKEAGERLYASPEFEAACELLEQKRAAVADAAYDLEQAKEEALAMLPEFGGLISAPEPEITATAPESLFDSGDDYTTATLKLIAHKRRAGAEP